MHDAAFLVAKGRNAECAGIMPTLLLTWCMTQARSISSSIEMLFVDT